MEREKKKKNLKMSLRFKGGERLQRGRGIGGLLRLVKSVFSPLVKSAGKSIMKAATSNAGKTVMNSIKDQAIDSGMKLAADALRGEDMEESLQQEIQHVKRKAADGIESVRRVKKQRVSKPKVLTKRSTKQNQLKTPAKQNQLKTDKRRNGKKKDLFD